jgi:hypothetical protein
MFRKHLKVFVLSLFVGLCAGFIQRAACAQSVEGDVKWVACSTLCAKTIEGHGATVAGKLTKDAEGKVAGTLTASLGKMTTENPKRDGHMHEKYMETAKFPTAELQLDPVKASEAEFPWTGTLKIKGQTKPVAGKGWVRGDKMWAEFETNIADFPAIGVPEWAGLTVAGKATITVNAKVSP